MSTFIPLLSKAFCSRTGNAEERDEGRKEDGWELVTLGFWKPN
jgi:hypothetical protein